MSVKEREGKEREGKYSSEGERKGRFIATVSFKQRH